MTNKHNITLTDRQLDILTIGLGTAILDFIERTKRGDTVSLGNQTITAEELTAVQNILVNKLGEPTAPAGYELSNLHRFVLGGALGSLARSSPVELPESMKSILNEIIRALDLNGVDRREAVVTLHARLTTAQPGN